MIPTKRNQRYATGSSVPSGASNVCRVATRYDKTATSDLGFAQLAAIRPLNKTLHQRGMVSLAAVRRVFSLAERLCKAAERITPRR